ncbi:hypothetical protein KC357_g273 [Hortaea werneckii]|nr:hypothetical protein KC357_g273 [Hortaea werneckii]
MVDRWSCAACNCARTFFETSAGSNAGGAEKAWLAKGDQHSVWFAALKPRLASKVHSALPAIANDDCAGVPNQVPSMALCSMPLDEIAISSFYGALCLGRVKHDPIFQLVRGPVMHEHESPAPLATQLFPLLFDRITVLLTVAYIPHSLFGVANSGAAVGMRSCCEVFLLGDRRWPSAWVVAGSGLIIMDATARLATDFQSERASGVLVVVQNPECHAGSTSWTPLPASELSSPPFYSYFTYASSYESRKLQPVGARTFKTFDDTYLVQAAAQFDGMVNSTKSRWQEKTLFAAVDDGHTCFNFLKSRHDARTSDSGCEEAVA